MQSDKRLAVMVLGIIIIGILTFATVAVAQNHIQQRECFAAGCAIWQNCDRLPGCPLHDGAPVQASGCACC